MHLKVFCVSFSGKIDTQNPLVYVNDPQKRHNLLDYRCDH